MGRRVAVLIALLALTAACSGGREDASPTAETAEASDTATTAARSSTTVRPKASSSTTTRPLAAGLEGILVDAYGLKVGECFNHYIHYQNFQPIEIFTQRSCEATHDGEMIHRVDYAAPANAPFPGHELLGRVATKVCYEAFPSYIGTPYETSRYKLGFLLPPQDRWEAQGFRTIGCYVTLPTRTAKLTERVRNSAV